MYLKKQRLPIQENDVELKCEILTEYSFISCNCAPDIQFFGFLAVLRPICFQSVIVLKTLC